MFSCRHSIISCAFAVVPTAEERPAPKPEKAFAPLDAGYYAAHRKPFDAILKKYGKTFAQITLRWEIQKGLIIIPKSSHPEYINPNFDIFDFSLDDSDMALIDAMDIDRASFELGTPDCFDWAYEPL